MQCSVFCFELWYISFRPYHLTIFAYILRCSTLSELTTNLDVWVTVHVPISSNHLVLLIHWKSCSCSINFFFFSPLYSQKNNFQKPLKPKYFLRHKIFYNFIRFLIGTLIFLDFNSCYKIFQTNSFVIHVQS